MVFTAKPFIQGKFTVITGPVGSDKVALVASFLDHLVDSGYRNDHNVGVFRHPADDLNPEFIGRHQVQVTDNLDSIFQSITPQTRTVFLVGAAHYTSPDIVGLADAVVRSNRDLIVAGLNLDSRGKPYGYMPNLITLADEIILAKAICSYPGCRSIEANRSKGQELNFEAFCAHHYTNECPPIPKELAGSLKLYLGPMFSGKSTRWSRELNKVKKVGWDPIVLNYSRDVRDGNTDRENSGKGYITLHNGSQLEAVLVRDGSEVKNYLTSHPNQKVVFINEAQFMAGLYQTIFDLIPQGYQFHVDGLSRGFNRGKFGDIADLVCLADTVDMSYATCVVCGDPATENQRMKRVNGTVMPAHYDDPLEAVGGKDTGKAEFFYEARCLKDWILIGEPS